MKIGILTFHWSDNYGAVLQCYALQQFLKEQGHEVSVVNYAPLKYSLFFTKILLHPNLINKIKVVKLQKEKHFLLNKFRYKYLDLTQRIFKASNIKIIASNYDALISGSDQVLNPSFLLYGEKGISPAYFLPFGGTKRIGYAVSFGCTVYPNDAQEIAKSFINNFDVVGLRENTGEDVLGQLDYQKTSTVVPDPTILYGNHLFDDFQLRKQLDDYYCVYMLRSDIHLDVAENVVYMDDTKQPVSMEKWISTIKFSKGLITNSYHGMIMAILNHIPFAVILEKGIISGMNDRFFTLLDRIGLGDRVYEKYTEEVFSSLNRTIDWLSVENRLDEYRTIGSDFLSKAITKNL